MNIEVVNKKKEFLTLRISGVGIGYLNSVRRLMMTEVPVLAIENVEFRKNSSALYDELVAHRLGMLSIKTDAKSYNLPKECKCKGAGCAQCQVKMTLKVAGPKTAYASDLQSQDPKATPVFGKTPIVKLLEGQELELEATAVMGQGIEHSKWDAGLVFYKEVPHVTIVSQPENAKALVAKYPEVLTLKNNKLAIDETKLWQYDLIEAIVSESDGSIKVDYKDDYYLTVESWQHITPQEIVTTALERFDQQLDELKKLVKEA